MPASSCTLRGTIHEVGARAPPLRTPLLQGEGPSKMPASFPWRLSPRFGKLRAVQVVHVDRVADLGNWPQAADLGDAGFGPRLAVGVGDGVKAELDVLADREDPPRRRAEWKD